MLAATDRSEADSRKTATLRRCICTGERRPREELIRFVVGPDAAIVPDIESDLPGRGLWLTARRDMIEAAGAKKLFARAARTQVRTPIDLSDQVERLLARRCTQLIGLARRAGAVAVGFETVRDWLKREKVAVLLTAADGAEGGARKLGAIADHLRASRVLTASELGSAVGREMAVHVAIADGGLATRIAIELQRLSGLRGDRDGMREEKADGNE